MNFFEYSDKEHAYYADGRLLPSVTQILDATGHISQYCKQEEARFRGTKVHEYCALDDIKHVDLRTIASEYRGYLTAWRKFRFDTGFEPTLIEHRIDCLEFGYSGRLDRLGEFTSRMIPLPTVLDIKTSKSGVVPDYGRLQTVAYGYALDPKSVFGRIVVSLKPDGKYNTKPYPFSTYLADKAEFLNLVKQQKESQNGRNTEVPN